MKYDMIEFGSLLIGSTRNGISKPKSIRGIGIPMIRMGELFRYDRIPELRELELVPLTDSEKDKFLLKKFDLLFARRSLTLQGAGKCSIYIGPENTTTFESSIIRARIDPNKANPLFYYYYFQSSLGKALISSIAEQVAVAGIRGSDLIRLKVHYFDRRTQDKISNILSILDSKIELNNKIIFNLEQLAQTLFKHWFIDFEFPNENGEPYKSSGGKMVQSKIGEIPEGWEIKSLDTIAHYENGLAMQKYRPDNEKESLPVLKIRELNQGYVDSRSDRCTKNIKESVKVYDGDVIFSWSGTLLVKIWFGGEAGLNQHLFKVTSKYYPKWFYYLWTKHYLERFINIASDKATTMGHIRRADLSDAKVFVPPDHLLKNFNKVFSPILDMIIIKGIEERKLSRLRDELLPKLLSGEIELPDESEVTEHV